MGTSYQFYVSSAGDPATLGDDSPKSDCITYYWKPSKHVFYSKLNESVADLQCFKFHIRVGCATCDANATSLHVTPIEKTVQIDASIITGPYKVTDFTEFHIKELKKELVELHQIVEKHYSTAAAVQYVSGAGNVVSGFNGITFTNNYVSYNPTFLSYVAVK